MAGDPLTLRVLRFLPRNLISRAFGCLARIERPRWLARRMIGSFCRRFDVDLADAARPIEDYRSLVDFFTRELRPGARAIDTDPGAIVSPVDGVAGACGRVESGCLIQAKGMPYTAASLLGDADEAARFEGGAFATLYLSPRDYHRVHVPVDGALRRTIYEPGTLWPVNAPAVARIPNLFAVNERVTALIDTDGEPVAVVMVGATNVGRMTLSHIGLVTNRGLAPLDVRHDPRLPVARGDHLGTFELGSTVVLLAAGQESRFALDSGQAVRMGARIGSLDSP